MVFGIPSSRASTASRIAWGNRTYAGVPKLAPTRSHSDCVSSATALSTIASRQLPDPPFLTQSAEECEWPESVLLGLQGQPRRRNVRLRLRSNLPLHTEDRLHCFRAAQALQGKTVHPDRLASALLPGREGRPSHRHTPASL